MLRDRKQWGPPSITDLSVSTVCLRLHCKSALTWQWLIMKAKCSPPSSVYSMKLKVPIAMWPLTAHISHSDILTWFIPNQSQFDIELGHYTKTAFTKILIGGNEDELGSLGFTNRIWLRWAELASQRLVYVRRRWIGHDLSTHFLCWFFACGLKGACPTPLPQHKYTHTTGRGSKLVSCLTSSGRAICSETNWNMSKWPL